MQMYASIDSLHPSTTVGWLLLLDMFFQETGKVNMRPKYTELPAKNRHSRQECRQAGRQAGGA